MGKPSLPKDHRAWGNEVGSRSRFQTIQVMQMAYEAISADSWSDKIALKAAFEPRLMSESKMVMTSVMQVALTGMCTLLSMREIQVEQGSPRSRARLQACRAHDAVNDTLPTINVQTVSTVKILVPIFVSGMASLKM